MGPIVLGDSQHAGPGPSPPYDPALPLEVYPVYFDAPNLDRETDVLLYHLVNSPVLPTASQDPTGDTIVMWPGGAAGYGQVLTIIAIDQAGNVGNPRVVSYTAP